MRSPGRLKGTLFSGTLPLLSLTPNPPMETTLIKTLIAAIATTVALAAATACAHAQVQAQPFGQHGDWLVEFVPADPNPRARMGAHCRATRVTGNRSGLRFVIGKDFSWIDYMESGALQPGDRYEVEYWFDRNRSEATVDSAQMVRDNEGSQWMRIPEPKVGVYEILSNGDVKTFTVKVKGRRDQWEFPVEGGLDAFGGLMKCGEERVQNTQAAPPPRRQAAPPPVAQVQPPPPPPPSAQPQGRQADCLMTIRGRNFIDGRCQFESDKDGSFRVFGEKYFAYVNIMSRGVADASWNGNPPTQHAQEPLGELRRNGACWESNAVRICAWGLGERPRSLPPLAAAPPPPPPAVQAPPPMQAAPPPRAPAPGQSFYAKEEGGLCVDIAGGRLNPGTPIQLWGCHSQAPQRFGVRGGQVFVTANPGLCVDGGDRQQLRLVDCRTSRTQWRYDPRVGQVRSNSGLCWDVSNGKYDQRTPVIAYQCHNGGNQKFVLNN